MASFGRVQGALNAITQETTMALANLNFDFTLVKIEAPAEYHELGRALSTRRRSVAEQGSSHVSAQKLGALFKDALPSTPSLFKAYGHRVSEIAQSSAINPKTDKKYGPFAEHIGVDGTTIWAAATSGNAAVAIHLLACMLARIWSAAQAVCIWEQIVKSRKEELSIWDEQGVIPVQNFYASRIELSRENLAEWDASARAWLRAADIAKKLNQSQLMLIVENLDIPVNKNMEVYESVMLAWKTALSAVDKLVQGSSLSIHNGAVLLGLSAWHLYPDLNVTGSVTKTARQNDNLIAPGVIATIGLHGNECEPEVHNGVYWSLPLAHVRYYGDAVVSERSIKSGHSRIFIKDIWQVTLGSLLRLWGHDGRRRVKALELIEMMWHNCMKELAGLEPNAWKVAMCDDSWLRQLADAAKRYLHSNGDEKRSCENLFGLGQRNNAFFGPGLSTDPILGLTDSSLLEVLKPSKRIEYLRNIAPSYQKSDEVLVVRTCEKKGSDIVTLQLATVISRGSNQVCRKRWVYKAWNSGRPKNTRVLLEIKEEEELFSLDPDSLAARQEGRCFRWDDPPLEFLDDTAADGNALEQVVVEQKQRNSFWRKAQREHRPNRPAATFEYVFGDVETAALFRRKPLENVDLNQAKFENFNYQPEVTLENILDAFAKEMVDPYRFLHFLCVGNLTHWHVRGEKDPSEAADLPAPKPSRIKAGHLVNETLRALATVTKLYSKMSNATVALKIATHGAIRRAKWMQKDLRDSQSKEQRKYDSDSGNNLMLPYKLSRRRAFACIAMFESGGFDLYPNDLHTVLAVASGDSIFVAAPILNDPATHSNPDEIRRIVGNIGRAGIAFLIPPKNPRTLEPQTLELESWRVINHDQYDGKIEDSFQTTTLHLGFSGYEFALDIGDHGGVYREAFFLETLIRVHDRGAWIADLDALRCLESPNFSSSENSACTHTDDERNRLPEFDLVTIDRWEELLARPRHAGVVKAHRNWLARLAAAVVSIQMENKTVVCNDERCWKCIEKARETGVEARSQSKDDSDVIFIC